MLGALANNGGPTQTRVPLPGSPLINAGTTGPLPRRWRPISAAAASPACAAAGVDIGAVETGTPFVVSSQFNFNTGRQAIQFNFDLADDIEDASLDPTDITVTNLTTNQVVPAANINVLVVLGGNSALFTFTGFPNNALPDGRYRAVLHGAGVNDNAGVPLGEDATLDLFFLNGDANRDARVNLLDFNVLAANFNQSNRTFSQGDFNYDGQVNLLDFNILASRFNTALSTVPSFRPRQLSPAAEDARHESWIRCAMTCLDNRTRLRDGGHMPRQRIATRPSNGRKPRTAKVA